MGFSKAFIHSLVNGERAVMNAQSPVKEVSHQIEIRLTETHGCSLSPIRIRIIDGIN